MKLKVELPKVGSKKVAIDWGSSALKIVSASRLKHTYLINDYVSQKVDENLSGALSKIWHTNKFPVTNIVLCLDGASTLVRIVDFPRMDKKVIRGSLGFELSRYIPFSQEEVYFDFSILDIPTTADHIKLLIVSVKKAFLEEKIGILEAANILPSKVTLSPISLANAFLKFFPGSTVI